MSEEHTKVDDVQIQLAVGEQRFKTLEGKVVNLETSVEGVKNDLKGINERQHDQIRKMDSIDSSLGNLVDKMDAKIFDDKEGLIAVCSNTRVKFTERFGWLRTIFVSILLLVVGLGAKDIYQNVQNKKYTAEMEKKCKVISNMLLEAKEIKNIRIGDTQ